jgi:hypothetical protein
MCGKVQPRTQRTPGHLNKVSICVEHVANLELVWSAPKRVELLQGWRQDYIATLFWQGVV